MKANTRPRGEGLTWRAAARRWLMGMGGVPAVLLAAHMMRSAAPSAPGSSPDTPPPREPVLACERPLTLPESVDDLSPVDIDFMLRGYFFVRPPAMPGVRVEGISGAELPLTERPAVAGGWPRGLHVVALLDEWRAFAGGCEGFTVLVVNATGAPVRFRAQDYRLYMVQEMKGPDGRWAPIEHLPPSPCGLSYHSLTLEDARYWDFQAPRYTGTIPARLRVRLMLAGEEGGPEVYSSEFDGSVNPGQLTTGQGHEAQNVMAPHEDWLSAPRDHVRGGGGHPEHERRCATRARL